LGRNGDQGLLSSKEVLDELTFIFRDVDELLEAVP
jgi:hypothetical protein